MLKNLLLISLLFTSGCKSLDLCCPEPQFIQRKTLFVEKVQKTSETLLPSPEQSLDPLSCPITPRILDKITLPPLYKSNNLRKRIGYASEAEGEKIIVSGIITDAQCRPIGNARVDIWQADSHGYYKSFQPNPYLNDTRLYKKSGLLFTENYASSSQADENFTGSGSMTSNNLGHFYFLTVKPGKSKGQTSRIHIRITHKSFPEFHGLLFFPENKEANILQKPDKILESDGKNYYYKITLASENDFNEY